MLAPLDLLGIFTGKSRSDDDFAKIRPLIYSCVDPAKFLVQSVDYARKNQEDQLTDSSKPVYWLAEARDAVVEAKGQLTQDVLRVLRSSLLNCLDSTLSPRERAQIWYCLRSLGVPPSGLEQNKILGVVVEFFGEEGPLLIYSSPDKFAAAIWDKGSAKASIYEEGPANDLAQRVCQIAASVADRIELGNEPPRSPTSGQVGFCFMTPGGYRKAILSEEEVEDLGLLELYNNAISLVEVLTGTKDSSEVYGEESSGFGGSSNPYAPSPMALWDPKWVYGSVWRRALAFFIDCLFFGVLWGALVYLSVSYLTTLSFLSLLVVVSIVVFSIPFMAAWMESSPSWGFRTVGKSMVGLCIASINTSGGPYYPQALARNMVKWFVSPLLLYSGFLWAFFHRYKRTWHDVLGETVVLYDAPVKKGEESIEDLRSLIEEMRLED